MEWKPTDVTILFVYCWISTCFGPTGPSSREFVQLFTQPLVQYLYRSGRVLCNVQSTRTERYRYWTNGCVNSCTNSREDGPVGPKHVEIQQYTNKIVTSVGFHSICWKDARYKKLKIYLRESTLKKMEIISNIYNNKTPSAWWMTSHATCKDHFSDHYCFLDVLTIWLKF